MQLLSNNTAQFLQKGLLHRFLTTKHELETFSWRGLMIVGERGESTEHSKSCYFNKKPIWGLEMTIDCFRLGL